MNWYCVISWCHVLHVYYHYVAYLPSTCTHRFSEIKNIFYPNLTALCFTQKVVLRLNTTSVLALLDVDVVDIADGLRRVDGDGGGGRTPFEPLNAGPGQDQPDLDLFASCRRRHKAARQQTQPREGHRGRKRSTGHVSRCHRRLIKARPRSSVVIRRVPLRPPTNYRRMLTPLALSLLAMVSRNNVPIRFDLYNKLSDHEHVKELAYLSNH